MINASISHEAISRIFSKQLMELPTERFEVFEKRGDRYEKGWNLLKKD